MHNYGETDLITKLLNIAMVVVLVLGIISGIGYGIMEMKLDEGAAAATLEAMELRSEKVLLSSEEERLEELEKLSTEKKWTMESTISMIVVWVISGIIALLLFCKRHQIEMLDRITMVMDKHMPQTE